MLFYVFKRLDVIAVCVISDGFYLRVFYLSLYKYIFQETEFRNIYCDRGSVLGTRSDRDRLPRHGGKFCFMIRKY